VEWPTIRQALAAREPERVAHFRDRAAVAILLRDGARGIEALFIHRAEHPQDPWSGHMAFPGGRSEEDESPLETAVRETREELGIDLRDAEILGALDELRPVRRHPLDLVIAPFVFRVPADVAMRPNHEVSAACWFSLDDLMDGRHVSTYDYAEGSTVLRFPCFRVEERVIWGLTYRMFGELAARLRLTRAAVP
jgi:8-oxo-dGTP pyrophosphatase MutT (NUDIX family)